MFSAWATASTSSVKYRLGSYAGSPDCPVGRGIQSWVTDIDQRARQAIEKEFERITITRLLDRVHVGT